LCLPTVLGAFDQGQPVANRFQPKVPVVGQGDVAARMDIETIQREGAVFVAIKITPSANDHLIEVEEIVGG
jgi:hypothetical protein